MSYVRLHRIKSSTTRTTLLMAFFGSSRGTFIPGLSKPLAKASCSWSETNVLCYKRTLVDLCSMTMGCNVKLHCLNKTHEMHYILTSPSDNSSSSSSSDSNPIWGSSSISTIVNEYSTGIRQINTVTEEFTTPPSFTCEQQRFSRVRVTLKPWRKQSTAEEWFRCWRTWRLVLRGYGRLMEAHNLSFYSKKHIINKNV